jgi:hypothetical protein
MRPPCLWDNGPPPCSNLNSKVYEGVHTPPPSGFKHVTSKEETHVCFYKIEVGKYQLTTYLKSPIIRCKRGV